jgi:hypothetical protein
MTEMTTAVDLPRRQGSSDVPAGERAEDELAGRLMERACARVCNRPVMAVCRSISRSGSRNQCPRERSRRRLSASGNADCPGWTT